jgi:hypothetical protein
VHNLPGTNEIEYFKSFLLLWLDFDKRAMLEVGVRDLKSMMFDPVNLFVSISCLDMPRGKLE